MPPHMFGKFFVPFDPATNSFTRHNFQHTLVQVVQLSDKSGDKWTTKSASSAFPVECSAFSRPINKIQVRKYVLSNESASSGCHSVQFEKLFERSNSRHFKTFLQPPSIVRQSIASKIRLISERIQLVCSNLPHYMINISKHANNKLHKGVSITL